MTSRKDFGDEEWTRIRRAPCPSQEELLAAVALDIQAMAQHRQNPLGDFKPRGGEQVLEELRAVNELVTARATPEEAAALEMA
jgi:hypothetical protein